MADSVWTNVLKSTVDAANKICSVDYYEAYLPIGSVGMMNTHIGLLKGQETTGIPDSAWPPIFSDRVKAGNLSPISREEYDSWRSMYGCGSASKINVFASTYRPTISTLTWVVAGVAAAGLVVVALYRNRKTSRKR